MYTVRVRIKLFSKDANPNVDPPLLHKSPQYVDALVANGEAVMLDARNAQLLYWHSRSDDSKREMRGGLGDWCVRDCSLLPHGEILRITTRQRVS